MSLCINPICPHPNHPANLNSRMCSQCGSELLVQQRYRVVRLLNDQGGFGKIYEVDDLGSPKVLKVLIEKNPKAVELFKQEAEVLLRLNHRGIPQVEADGYFTYWPRQAAEPLHCLIMEKIPGQNLEEWLADRGNRPISQTLALNWLKQLVEILQHVHQLHYFHRDIKPANIMYGRSAQLVLVDFGTARELTHTYLAKVGGGQQITSITSAGYTPLEQVNSKAVPQSDFYALGRSFVYLLTGFHPTEFEEDPRTGQLLWRQATEGISPLLADFLDELMEPFPGNRPKNTLEILQRLDRLERQLEQPPAPHPVPLRQPRPKLQPKFQTQWLAGGALLLTILTGIGVQAYTEWRFNSDPISLLHSRSLLNATLKGHRDWVNAIAISADGQTLVSGSADTTIKLWNLRSGDRSDGLQQTLTGHRKWVRSVALSPDGTTLVSASDDKTLKIWTIRSNGSDRIAILQRSLSNDREAVHSVAISPDGNTLVSGSSDGTIKLWNLPDAMGDAISPLEATLKGHSNWVNAVAVTPDGQTLVSGSSDKTIKVWDLSDRTLKKTLTGHRDWVSAIAVTPDGQTLVSGSYDGTLKLWDLSSGKLKATLKGHQNYVLAVAVTPDGNTLVSGSSDGTLKVWNLPGGTLRTPIQGFTGYVRAIAIAPDGQTIITGGLDNTIKIWSMPQ